LRLALLAPSGLNATANAKGDATGELCDKPELPGPKPEFPGVVSPAGRHARRISRAGADAVEATGGFETIVAAALADAGCRSSW
jgi:hypothetical protein